MISIPVRIAHKSICSPKRESQIGLFRLDQSTRRPRNLHLAPKEKVHTSPLGNLFNREDQLRLIPARSSRSITASRLFQRTVRRVSARQAPAAGLGAVAPEPLAPDYLCPALNRNKRGSDAKAWIYSSSTERYVHERIANKSRDLSPFRQKARPRWHTPPCFPAEVANPSGSAERCTAA